MPEDLDDLLRRAMKTLDDEVPSGYFEALPRQTLSRLEVEMQQGIPGTLDKREPMSAAPPPAVGLDTDDPTAPTERVEDSGLHDIRNLAQSTKQRLSSRRISTAPPPADDVLASSSASWKNLALPQPAKMVSLPELADLPSKQEVLAKEKAGRKAAKEAAKEAKVSAKELAAAAAPVAAAPAAAAPAADISAATAASQPFASFAARKPSRSGRTIAIVGAGLAAAAGVAFFVMNQSSSKSAAPAAAPTQVAQAAPEKAAAPTVTPIPEAAPAAATADETAQAAPTEEAQEPDGNAAAGAAATGAAAEATADDSHHRVHGRGHARPSHDAKAAKDADKDDAEKPDPKATDTKATDKTDGKADAKAGKGKGEDSDPSFDELLKEAGVDQHKVKKPKLDKKELSGDDFKQGMSKITPRAQGCFQGTQGMAKLRMTVAPSGKVEKVTISGMFAGKAEGNCVSAAVKSATFPPWDGGPQTFGYTFLLAE